MWTFRLMQEIWRMGWSEREMKATWSNGLIHGLTCFCLIIGKQERFYIVAMTFLYKICNCLRKSFLYTAGSMCIHADFQAVWRGDIEHKHSKTSLVYACLCHSDAWHAECFYNLPLALSYSASPELWVAISLRIPSIPTDLYTYLYVFSYKYNLTNGITESACR